MGRLVNKVAGFSNTATHPVTGILANPYLAYPTMGSRETGSWTPANLTPFIREPTDSGLPDGNAGGLASRNPRLLFRLSGVFLLRLAERTLRGLLFQEPPRFTRRQTLVLFPG